MWPKGKAAGVRRVWFWGGNEDQVEDGVEVDCGNCLVAWTVFGVGVGRGWITMGVGWTNDRSVPGKKIYVWRVTLKGQECPDTRTQVPVMLSLS